MILIAAFGAAPSASAALKDYPFRLTATARGEQELITAQNDGPSPITVRAKLRGTNIASTQPWPATAVVPAHSTLSLGALFAADQSQPYDYTLRYSYYVGRIDAQPSEETTYRLPFEDGLSFPITQAYGARLTSHNNIQNRYAVDFAMPEGTPIVAARDGIVVDVTLTYHRAGFDPSFLDRANTVTVVHDDGTIAEYAHLSPGTPIVHRGERVHAGQLIAYSGNTGYSSAPHLHFVVSKPGLQDGKLVRMSLPFLFYDFDPPVVFAPRTGMTRVANYSTPAANAENAVATTATPPKTALHAVGSARAVEAQRIVPSETH